MSDRPDRFHDEPGERSTEGDEVRTPHDALAAYALGALDVDEQRLFELHLFVCRACRADLQAYRRTAELLPYGLPQQQPPDGARERLLAHARAEASESPTVSVPVVADDDAPTVTGPIVGDDEAPTIVQAAPAIVQAVPTVVPAVPTVVQAVPFEVDTRVESPPAPVRRAPPRRGFQIKLASVGWAAALLFTLAAGLFVGAWNATGPHVSPDVQLLARLPGGQVLTLLGTGAPEASARLFVVENGRRAELAVDALPPLPPGRVYQLWFSEPGQPARTGGAFSVDQDGDAVARLAIPTPLERVQAISVTQEPAPGLVSPTGVRLLEWSP